MLIPLMNKGIAANQAGNNLMKQVQQKYTCKFQQERKFHFSEMKMLQTSVFVV